LCSFVRPQDVLGGTHLCRREVHDPPIWLSILLGIGIGFLSGLTGTGGGIFLSPVIIFLAWSDLRTTSGIAAVFIFGNSIAGLLGNLAMVRSLPSELPMYIAAVMLGAWSEPPSAPNFRSFISGARSA
jgi:uncharacterized membrane protein YfcA